MPRPRPDFLNKKFGRLTILNDLGNFGKFIIVKAICECGIIKEYKWNSIQQGKATSCGCYSLELIKQRLTTHGLSGHPLFTVWNGILGRCNCVTHKQYEDYGARGIIICKEWETDFVAFYNWAISNGWTNENRLTVDRKNNDAGYSPENCRMVTNTIQQRNKRSNINVTINGVTKCLKEWCIELGLNYKLTYQRHFRDNLPFEKLLTNALKSNQPR